MPVCGVRLNPCARWVASRPTAGLPIAGYAAANLGNSLPGFVISAQSNRPHSRTWQKLFSHPIYTIPTARRQTTCDLALCSRAQPMFVIQRLPRVAPNAVKPRRRNPGWPRVDRVSSPDSSASTVLVAAARACSTRLTLRHDYAVDPGITDRSGRGQEPRPPCTRHFAVDRTLSVAPSFRPINESETSSLVDCKLLLNRTLAIAPEFPVGRGAA